MAATEVRHWTAARIHAVRARAVTSGTPWHDHDHLVLGLIDGGTRVIETRDGIFAVAAGQGFALPPRCAHRCLGPGTVDYRILCLDVAASPLPRCGAIVLPAWKAAFERVFAAAVGTGAAPDDDLTALAVTALGVAASAVEPRAVRLARRTLARDLAERTDLAALAEAAGLSPFHLQRLFTRVTGLSPHRQQMLARLRLARSLLLSGAALKDAAAASGFADQSHLTRVFSGLMGLSPGRYRAQLRPARRGGAG